MASTTIDHAIAIPTRPDNVWEQVRNLENNPVWQANCEAVRILTTNKNGRGTRWRSTSHAGADTVIEVTAWYEGLGYEYTIVDGTSFTSNRGVIRLQDAPEGTVVQWTFTYEIGGMFSGLRNALGTKRSVETDIINSLKNLYNYMKHIKADEQYDATQSKAYLREAPDVEERFAYQSRYPVKSATDALDSPVTLEVKSNDDERFMPPADEPVSIPEPAITKDDTRPNPTTSEVAAVPETPETVDDDKPFRFSDEEIEQARIGMTEKQDIEPVPTEPTRNLFLEDAPPVPTSASTTPSPFDEGDVGVMDTGQISVFELFGLQKPSETQQMRAIQDDNTGNALPLSVPKDKEISRRIGLRAKMRARNVKVRLPQNK